MSRRIKKNGTMQKVSLDKNKKYKYSGTGDLVEATGTLGDNEISMSGSKSSLRRVADMERNISILATTMLTTDAGVGVDSPAQVKAAAASDATTKANAAQSAASSDATTKANNAKSQAISAAATDATTKANNAKAQAIAAAASDATTKANAAKAAAIAAVTNGAGAAFDTLVEIQNAMATDSELSSAISSVTSSAASTASADATSKANAALAAAKVYADANDTDTNTWRGISNSTSSTSTSVSASSAAVKAAYDRSWPNTTYSATQMRDAVKTVDGSGSGLDADLLDGQQGSYYASVASVNAKQNSGDYVTHSEYKNFGGIGIGSSVTTTALLIADLTTKGFFNHNHAVGKCSWSYAGNGDLTDTGYGTFELAGCVVETFKSGVDKHVRITRPNTGGDGPSVLVYNDQNNGTYSPGWREMVTSYNGHTQITGTLTATGDITAYSDDSLKTNVQVIDGALNKVDAIRGVTFDRIEDGSTSTGVVAQELLAVLPEAVHTDSNGIHSVAYGNISGLLIESIKELKSMVESQAAMVDYQAAEIAKLKK